MSYHYKVLGRRCVVIKSTTHFALIQYYDDQSIEIVGRNWLQTVQDGRYGVITHTQVDEAHKDFLTQNRGILTPLTEDEK